MDSNSTALDTPEPFEKEQLLNLLADIQKESADFQKVILTDEESKEIAQAAEALDIKVREAAYAVLNHLKEYQQSGWQEFIGEEDGGNGNMHRVI